MVEPECQVGNVGLRDEFQSCEQSFPERVVFGLGSSVIPRRAVTGSLGKNVFGRERFEWVTPAQLAFFYLFVTDLFKQG